jgi:hypothetical protein
VTSRSTARDRGADNPWRPDAWGAAEIAVSSPPGLVQNGSVALFLALIYPDAMVESGSFDSALARVGPW